MFGRDLDGLEWAMDYLSDRGRSFPPAEIPWTYSSVVMVVRSAARSEFQLNYIMVKWSNKPRISLNFASACRDGRDNGVMSDVNHGIPENHLTLVTGWSAG